jgi:protein KRI1
LQREEEEYQEFLRREVGEDLYQLIEVDQDAVGIRESSPGGKGDREGRKKKKKDKGKEKEKGRSKAEENKEHEDQEFLMKFVPLTPLVLPSRADAVPL